LTQGCQTGLFQVVWPKKILLAFWIFLALSQVGWSQQFCLAFWVFFGLFSAEVGAYEENIAIPFFSVTHLQNVCDKCYIRRQHSDISNI